MNHTPRAIPAWTPSPKAFRFLRFLVIGNIIPLEDWTLDEALVAFERARADHPLGFAKSIYVGGRHIGDVWAYSLAEETAATCGVSLVIFDKKLWGKGIGSQVLDTFVSDLFGRHEIDCVVAYTFESNARSLAACLKAGFSVAERFQEEDGVWSCRLERRRPRSADVER